MGSHEANKFLQHAVGICIRVNEFNSDLELTFPQMVLVHFYHEISDGELYTILDNNLSDVEAFVKEIKRFIESYKSRQDQSEK